MNHNIKRTLVVGATVATLGIAGLAGAGMASADNTAGGTSLIEKLATKFNLNQDEVKAVFEADRTERHAQMQADQAERLAQAVTDGKLTQAQADHITAAQKELESLRGTGGPGSMDEATRTAVKEKMDALRTWAEENNVDMAYVGRGGHGGPGGGGPGGPGGERPASDAGTSSSN